MADADHAPAFWSSVATAFNSNHGVVFDLFNEPYITSWSCWLSGCAASHEVAQHNRQLQDGGDAVAGRTPCAEPAPPSRSCSAASTGRATVSQWHSFEPTDPAHQLVVSYHTYDFSGCNTESCWNSTIAPLAHLVPVVTGELGESGCKRTYIDPYMPWADAHGVSYLGWTWDATEAPSQWSCSGGPALIKNYTGRPTSFGAGLKKHLGKLARAARAAERKKALAPPVSHVELSHSDGVAVLTIDRPPANAMNVELLGELVTRRVRDARGGSPGGTRAERARGRASRRAST